MQKMIESSNRLKWAFSIEKYKTNAMVKWLRIHAPEVCLSLMVIIALLIRFILINLNWPQTTSDESFIDLMALHIAYHGELPIFYYGQGYMGTLEAYLGAVLCQILGNSVVSVRLGLLLFFALYLLCMYYLTCLLYSKKLALVTVALLSLGSAPVMTLQIRAIGGYAEIMFFGALVYCLVSYLALTSQRSVRAGRRALLYGLLGLVIGLALWSDFLIATCVMLAVILLILFCWRDLLSWAGLALGLGIMLGFSPVIIYNLSASAGASSWGAVVGLTGYSRVGGVSLLQQFSQVLLVSFPFATGGSLSTCAISEPMPVVQSITQFFPATHVLPCVLMHGSWVLGAIVLWISAAMLVLRALWRYRLSVRSWSYEERQHVILLSARCMLLISALLTFLLYVFSVRAGPTPRSSSRYLVCLFLATPAILWPLWNGWHTIEHATVEVTKRLRFLLIVRVGLLLFIALVNVQATVAIWNEVPAAQEAYDQQQRLIQDLSQIHATRIYSDYWTCARLVFQTQEGIICSVLNARLKPGQDRYMPYRGIVNADTSPAYVFQVNSAEAHAVEKASPTFAQPYRRYVFAGYEVYAVPN